MATFTVRVYLRGTPTREQYQRLHDDLATLGVVDYALATGGFWWRLPPAKYRYEGNATVSELLWL